MENSGARRILTVDDEDDIQELLRYTLESEGYSTIAAYTGEEALEKAVSESPDLVLLDLMLPGIGGLDVCRRLRSAPETRNLPVIMISAKGEEEDIVRGLELGADDYVTKPFSPKVLIARVQAVFRRGATEPGASRLCSGGLAVDGERHEASLDGEPLDLTHSEFAILWSLMSEPGKVLTRKRIISGIRGGQLTATDRSVDVHVTSLRKKLKDHAAKITTIRGVGYRFDG